MADFDTLTKAEPTELEVKNGPIWTQIEVSTYTGDRKTSPEITPKDIIEIETLVWEVIEELRDPKTGPGDRPELPINFAGDISERDVYCFEDRDIVASCFVRHREDFIGTKILWNYSQELVDRFKEEMEEPFSVRNVKVVAQSWVEQHHPEIVDGDK